MVQKNNSAGFTIVELLIVVVVIAILAAISVVTYNSIQTRAQNAKIKSDLAIILKAITIARVNNGSALYGVTKSGAATTRCLNNPSGTDLSTLNKTTDGCWTDYTKFLDEVSTASNVSIRDIIDPWGRPYYVNPNEDENSTTHVCMKDQIGTYSQPFIASVTNVLQVPLYKSSC